MWNRIQNVLCTSWSRGRAWRLPVGVIVVVASLLVGLPVFTADAASGGVYYVAITGNDANSGSQSQPWRTIQKAANTVRAGDTVIVQAGTYNERVQISSSGVSEEPVTFQGEGTVTTKGFTVHADYVTIRGFEITNTDNSWSNGVGILLEGSHCVIENNYVYYATRGGILIFAEPGEDTTRTDCLVRNNRLYRNAMYGIEIYGRNHTVEGNEIWGTIQYHPLWTNPPGYVDADGIRFFGAGHLVRRNYIHDITLDDPENINPHIDCFQTWEDRPNEAGNDIIFEQNFCENMNERMYAFMLENTHNLVIRNNVLKAFAHINTGGGGNSDLTVVNNVLTSDLSFPLQNYPVGVGLENSPNSIVRNNVFYDLPSHIVYVTGTSTQGLVVDHNLSYRSDGQALWGSPYPNDLWGVNPQFVDAAANDFRLSSSSPAIDAGFDLGAVVANDYDGTLRPQGASFDIGAYEYIQVASNTPPIADAGGPYSGQEGTPVSLDASRSSDPDGSIVAYAWDLDNDGQFDDATGIAASVAYADNSIHTVGLRVTDDGGDSHSTSVSFDIANVAPTVEAGSDQTVLVGASVNLEPASFSDPGIGDTHTATLDWGDGALEDGVVSESNGAGTVAGSHTYSTHGSYPVSVCVADDDNDTACDSLIIHVEPPPNAAPVANAGGPYSGSAGSPISLDGSGSSDPEGQALSYHWSFGDGNEAVDAGPAPAHTYGVAGSFDVCLTVADPGSLSHMACTTAAVSSAPPTETPIPTPTATPTADPTDSVVTGLAASTGEAYLVDRLVLRNPVYIDRRYIFKSIPEELLDTWYIRTANSDKNIKVEDHLQFVLTQGAMVYIAYNSRATTLPAWLGGQWEVTDLYLNSNDVPLRLYKQHFGAGTVVLGGNAAEPVAVAGSNYVVVIVPDETGTPTATPSPEPTVEPIATPAVIAGSGNVMPGGTIQIAIETQGIPEEFNLAALTIDVQYNSSVLSAVECVDNPDNGFDLLVCSVDNAGKVQLSAVRTGTILQSARLALITFQAVGSSGAATPLDVQIGTFADANGNELAVQDEDGYVTIDMIGQVPLGDVSCDAVVNVVDSLFVLQYEVGQKGEATQCPLGPDEIHYPTCDVNSDVNCNVIDALFLLQCSVNMANSFCPDNSLAFASSRADDQALVADSSATIAVTASSANAKSEEQLTILVIGNVGEYPGVGAATFDVRYDSTKLAPVACSPDPQHLFGESRCNLTYEDDGLELDSVRFGVISPFGVVGEAPIAAVTFVAKNQVTVDGAIQVVPVIWSDARGVSIPTKELVIAWPSGPEAPVLPPVRTFLPALQN